MRRRSFSGTASLCTLVVSLMLGANCFAAPDRAAAEHALVDGHVDDAVAMLNTLVAANGKDGAAHLLLCRAYYSEEASDLAVSECEAALASGGPSATTLHDWMGRAYGQKASHALIGALGLAKKVKIEFEAAVAADPGNGDAVNDLSEFYIGAPGIVGGSVGKALELASRVQASQPQAAHRIRGLAAEENKDYGTAESEFKAAVGVAGKTNAWVSISLPSTPGANVMTRLSRRCAARTRRTATRITRWSTWAALSST